MARPRPNRGFYKGWPGAQATRAAVGLQIKIPPRNFRLMKNIANFLYKERRQHQTYFRQSQPYFYFRSALHYVKVSSRWKPCRGQTLYFRDISALLPQFMRAKKQYEKLSWDLPLQCKIPKFSFKGFTPWGFTVNLSLCHVSKTVFIFANQLEARAVFKRKNWQNRLNRLRILLTFSAKKQNFPKNCLGYD